MVIVYVVKNTGYIIGDNVQPINKQIILLVDDKPPLTLPKKQKLIKQKPKMRHKTNY